MFMQNWLLMAFLYPETINYLGDASDLCSLNEVWMMGLTKNGLLHLFESHLFMNKPNGLGKNMAALLVKAR